MYRYEKPVNYMRSDYFWKNYWSFESRKLHRQVAVFSNLEYENIISLEMDPNVEWYCEYPLEANVFIGGHQSTVVLSTWVLYKSGEEVFQGVSYRESSSHENRNKIGLMAMWCLQNNLTFTFCNESTIEKGQFYIRNINVLAAKSRRVKGISPAADAFIIDYMKRIGQSSVEQLENSGYFEKNKTLDYLADLFYRGIITFINLENECISRKTEVKYIGC